MKKLIFLQIFILLLFALCLSSDIDSIRNIEAIKYETDFFNKKQAKQLSVYVVFSTQLKFHINWIQSSTSMDTSDILWLECLNIVHFGGKIASPGYHLLQVYKITDLSGKNIDMQIHEIADCNCTKKGILNFIDGKKHLLTLYYNDDIGYWAIRKTK